MKKQTPKLPTALKCVKATLVPGKTTLMPESRHKSGFGVAVTPDVGKATQFKPGVSGNPGGRPKSHGLLETLRAAVDFVGHDGRTVEQQLVEGLISEALDGRNRLAATALIFDRMLGRAAQQIDVNNITKATGTPAERISALLKLTDKSEGTEKQ